MDSQISEMKKQAWISALKLLAATPKTSKELTAKLLDRGFNDEVVAETIEKLTSQNLLSDKKYAEDLLNRFRHAKPSGRRKINFELKRHGLSENLRESVLEKFSNEEELQAAQLLAQTQWDRAAKLDDVKRKKKVYDFLIRRGFDFQIAREVMNEVTKNSKEQENSESL